MPQEETGPAVRFDQMNLTPVVCANLLKIGYERPTPIQAKTIPFMAAGTDVLGQARTGTGKTAAFALPLLSRIDLGNRRPQVLVLTPTRELAIQVADAFTTYGAGMKGLNVLAVYGGQSYGVQLSRLKRGVHVVVGTPGRLMDHLKRKTLTLDHLGAVVLDEADEMLHMGFIDDVEWILDQTPDHVQTALFSATMPGPIRKIAQKYLEEPKEILIPDESTGVETIKQQFWMVKGAAKAHALVRFLSARTFDGVIVFAKTKAATLDVARNLEENGFTAEALNGDMAQAARERTVDRFKNSRIDILVATDVAARGLDVDRVSLVVNYDMPSRVEPYVHRIGRTGRAGRTGEALLFVNRRERWMVKKLEKAVRQDIREVHLPSPKTVNKKRLADFKTAITRTLETVELDAFESLVTDYAEENGLPVAKVAAALARMVHGDTPLLLAAKREKEKQMARDIVPLREPAPKKKDRKTAGNIKKPVPLRPGMERYRIEVGECHGVKPGDIVGAISNEAGLSSKYIKGLCINEAYSLVDLPQGMPKEIFRHLKRTWVKSRPMAISKCA